MKHIICSLFGHKYKVKRRITNSIREVECLRCKKEWGMNDAVKAFVPMDGELRDLNDYILAEIKKNLCK